MTANLSKVVREFRMRGAMRLRAAKQGVPQRVSSRDFDKQNLFPFSFLVFSAGTMGFCGCGVHSVGNADARKGLAV